MALAFYFYYNFSQNAFINLTDNKFANNLLAVFTKSIGFFASIYQTFSYTSTLSSAYVITPDLVFAPISIISRIFTPISSRYTNKNFQRILKLYIEIAKTKKIFAQAIYVITKALTKNLSHFIYYNCSKQSHISNAYFTPLEGVFFLVILSK